jgi:rhamnogalacturonyl hydrolase YesR
VADADQLSRRLDEWVDQQQWVGYDPYDLRGHPLFVRLLRLKSRLSRKVTNRILAATERAPLLTRRVFGIKKTVNAKAMGLLVAAYANLARAKGDLKSLDKAKQCADWLLRNPSSGYHGLCWGYPFDWQSIGFLPRGTPSSVVSATVGDGLWRLYEATNEQRFWDACVSICEFFLKDLNRDETDEQTLCFSYTPKDRGHVHNANLFVAEFLARVGARMQIEEYVNMAVRAGNYALNEQRPDGSLNYFGTVDDKHNAGHRDCYHSGFETRALWGLWKATGDDRFRQAALRYLDFFYRTYLRDDGAVWLRPHSQYPIDIHGCAEALLCPAALREAAPSRFDGAWPKVLNWIVANMQNPDGSFAYRKCANGRICRIAYFRWGQAWMLRSLSEVMLATTRAESTEG